MNPIATGIVAGALIVGGQWARNKAPTVDNAIGIAGIALSLALLEQINLKLAHGFSVLILVSLAVVHLPTIVKALGYGEK